jgi:hypothetical protein
MVESGGTQRIAGVEGLVLTDDREDRIRWLRTELDEILESYQHPDERRIGYGNLRHEYSEWKDAGGLTTNIAVVYESPGGSTTQLNITYDHGAGLFSFLDHRLDDRVSTPDPREVLHAIQHEVTGIPAKRVATLHKQVEIWSQEGKSRSELLAELNKIFQNEFLGGRMTAAELKDAVQYVVKLRTAPA